MGKRTPKLYLLDIMESAGDIEEYTEGMDFEDFENDKKTVAAVVRNFEIIGEAANSIPEEVKIKHPDVNWKQMVGMRNILAHEYFGTELEIVWDAAKNDIPNLKFLIKKVLDSLGEQL